MNTEPRNHIHPFSSIQELENSGVTEMASSQGVFVTDSNGKSYLDGMAGLWCVNVGYGREELVKAAEVQMRSLPYYNTFFGTTNQPVSKLSQVLAEIAPDHINSFFYANSGSEGNDTIVRLLRYYWQIKGCHKKIGFISRIGSYHGSTMVCASLGGMSYMHLQGVLPLDGFHHVAPPYWWHEGREMDFDEFGLRTARKIESKILEVGAENIAAVIGEPVMAGIGIAPPPPTYWPEVERICREHNVLLVSDEVITGFGRTGDWFAHPRMGIKPDAMTMAKGLSSGYFPISAVGLSDEIVDVLYDSKEAINHGFTYSGHPVAAAVALANLDVMKRERLHLRGSEDIGNYFKLQLTKLDQHPLVAGVTVLGLIAGIELQLDRAPRTETQSLEKLAKYMSQVCLNHGLITRSLSQSLALCPPLSINREEIDLIVERMQIGLDAGLEYLKGSKHGK